MSSEGAPAPARLAGRLSDMRDVLGSIICASKTNRDVGLRTPRDVLSGAKEKKAVRREWTKDDLKTLKSLAKKKAGVKKIARALKRTPGATAAKAFVLGLSLDTRL
ncbi:hypothetical protein [Bradyrhizobium sp. F1.13.3]|uniref:hypothetical protein n=1 Tax=Bradyrhizobium sp. F1.13.3 TaxID=3156351 RepID=UPI0033958B9B